MSVSSPEELQSSSCVHQRRLTKERQTAAWKTKNVAVQKYFSKPRKCHSASPLSQATPTVAFVRETENLEGHRIGRSGETAALALHTWTQPPGHWLCPAKVDEPSRHWPGNQAESWAGHRRVFKSMRSSRSSTGCFSLSCVTDQLRLQEGRTFMARENGRALRQKNASFSTSEESNLDLRKISSILELGINPKPQTLVSEAGFKLGFL